MTDKRLLVVETDLVSTFKVATRDGNTLSAVIRQAWETGTLRTLTRNNSLTATGAHISIVGHITVEELRACVVVAGDLADPPRDRDHLADAIHQGRADGRVEVAATRREPSQRRRLPDGFPLQKPPGTRLHGTRLTCVQNVSSGAAYLAEIPMNTGIAGKAHTGFEPVPPP